MHRLLDELLAVYVVFQTPLLEEATLKSYLARLVISVEAFAFSTVPPSDQDAKATPPKEVIFSGTINHKDEPMSSIMEREIVLILMLSGRWTFS